MLSTIPVDKSVNEMSEKCCKPHHASFSIKLFTIPPICNFNIKINYL
jgi:hypothetical protein